MLYQIIDVMIFCRFEKYNTLNGYDTPPPAPKDAVDNDVNNLIGQGEP